MADMCVSLSFGSSGWAEGKPKQHQTPGLTQINLDLPDDPWQAKWQSRGVT